MSYLNFLPSSIISEGKNRACLIDVEKNHYCLIPKSLAWIFRRKQGFYIEDVDNTLVDDEKVIFKEYISFLESNGFAIVSDKEIYFKKFTLNNYKTPFTVYNIILDFKDTKNFKEKIDTVKGIHFRSVQVRLYFAPNHLFLNNLFDYLSEIDFNNIEVILNHNKSFVDVDYKRLFLAYRMLSRIIIMDYYENRWIVKEKIVGVKSRLDNPCQCGIISKSLFNTNLNSIRLSSSYNSCLFKKISIDVNGNIKNCPSMPESYGNIKDTTLEQALNKPDFKKYWNVTKDMIEVCKDCEFRYICTDCRAYTERTTFNKEEIDLSKPLKCGYNPYTNEWAEWSTNPLKQKAIEFYGMQDMVKKDA